MQSALHSQALLPPDHCLHGPPPWGFISNLSPWSRGRNPPENSIPLPPPPTTRLKGSSLQGSMAQPFQASKGLVRAFCLHLHPQQTQWGQGSCLSAASLRHQHRSSRLLTLTPSLPASSSSVILRGMEKRSVCKHVKLACLVYLTTSSLAVSLGTSETTDGPQGLAVGRRGGSSPPWPPRASGQVRAEASKLPRSVEAGGKPLRALLFLLTYFWSQSPFAGFLLALHGTQPLNGRLSQSSLHCSPKLSTIARESPFKQSTPHAPRL